MNLLTLLLAIIVYTKTMKRVVISSAIIRVLDRRKSYEIEGDLKGHNLVKYIKYSWQKGLHSSYISHNSLEYRGRGPVDDHSRISHIIRG